jgi:hydrogenase maturation protease
MDDFSSVLAVVLRGRTAFVGIGNIDRGDDGLGVRLAEALRDVGLENVLIAGTTPENHVAALADGQYDAVIFLDAVPSAGKPGTVVLIGASEIRSVFPQVSTHKFSLGTLACIVESGNGTKVWLLGVCPASINMGTSLSGTVKETVKTLTELITVTKTGGRRTFERTRLWN